MDQLLNTSIASTLAAMIAKTICYPFDTIKAQCYIERKPIQMNFKDITHAVKNIYESGGVKKFYKGGLIAIVGSGPAFSLYLTSYEFFKLKIKHYTESKLLLHLSCGLLAEIVSGVFWLPIDVVKERLQVQERLKSYHYTGSIDAIIKIIKQEGVLGLYRGNHKKYLGFGATLGFFGPYSALYFASFEYLKERTSQNYLLSSMGAFVFSSILTQPLSVSKMRIQVQYRKNVHQVSKDAQFNYRNQLHGIWRIFIEEGARALFRGYIMRCVYAGSLTTLNMTGTELIKSKIQKI